MNQRFGKHTKQIDVLEENTEDNYVSYALKLGYQALKMSIPGRRNHPDRQTFLGFGYSFFIEFKRKGEEPRPAQASRIKKWRKLGYTVYVCDNLRCAMQALDNEIAELEEALGLLK